MSLPEDTPLGFLRVRDKGNRYKRGGDNYDLVLALLAVAEAFMANKSGLAKEHFIAIVKELEERFGFVFARVPEEETGKSTNRRLFCTSCKKEVPENQVYQDTFGNLHHVSICASSPHSGRVSDIPQGWPGE